MIGDLACHATRQPTSDRFWYGVMDGEYRARWYRSPEFARHGTAYQPRWRRADGTLREGGGVGYPLFVISRPRP